MVAQVEMVGVAQYDLCLYVILELRHMHGLDRTYGAYGHEYGGLNHSVAGGDPAGPGMTGGVSVLKFKFQSFQNGITFPVAE